MSRLSVELLENNDIISKKILQAIADEFNDLISTNIHKIRNKIGIATVNFLKKTDTYESLINGKLAAHFGLPIHSRQNMVDSILQKIGDNIQVEHKTVKVFGKRFVNGLEIRVLVADFSDILSMIEANVTTEKGQVLPWLSWLILEGDKIIVSEHEIRLTGGVGRSGMAVMFKNNAAIWRVPPEYAGTYSDNWLTRAILVDAYDFYLKEIENILREELV